MHRYWLAASFVALGMTLSGCSRDPNSDNPQITPELQEKILAEDAAVDSEEGGKGSVRQ